MPGRLGPCPHIARFLVGRQTGKFHEEVPLWEHNVGAPQPGKASRRKEGRKVQVERKNVQGEGHGGGNGGHLNGFD